MASWAPKVLLEGYLEWSVSKLPTRVKIYAYITTRDSNFVYFYPENYKVRNKKTTLC